MLKIGKEGVKGNPIYIATQTAGIEACQMIGDWVLTLVPIRLSLIICKKLCYEFLWGSLVKKLGTNHNCYSCLGVMLG